MSGDAVTRLNVALEGPDEERVLSVLTPDEVEALGGLPAEAIAGTFEASDVTVAAFQLNPGFASLLHRVLAVYGPKDPGLQAAARSQQEGWLYVIDLRTPGGPQGQVPPEDIVGAFGVSSGSIVPDSYQPMKSHRIFTENGLVVLPPPLRQALVDELFRQQQEPPCDADEKGPAGKGVPTYRVECGAEVNGELQPVFPILMREDWERTPTQMCRPLIAGTGQPNIPWVALAHLIGGDGRSAPNRAYLRAERAEQIGKTVTDFESEALANVGMRPASWELTTPGGGEKVAVCADDYLAAEHCLVPSFMREAGTLLGSESLLVGIPSRGHLFATPLNDVVSGGEFAGIYVELIEKYFVDAGETGITPRLFIFIDGRINSVVEVG